MPLRRAQEQGRHPHELLFLLLCAVGAVVGLVVPSSRQTALEMVFGTHAWVWFAGLLFSSVLAIVSVFLSTPICLFIERAAMYLQATLFAVYAAAIFLFTGLGNAPVVIVWTVGGAIAAVIRSRQITKAVKVAKTLSTVEAKEIVDRRPRPWRRSA